jgi:hypothetical protein
MRSRFTRTVVALLLVVCIICPIVEMFDHWDHTLQTGNDTEYTLVALALCVGAAYSFVRFFAKCPLARSLARILFTSSTWMSFLLGRFRFKSLLFNAISPPPLELRI